MAPVYKVKLRSAIERPTTRLGEYLRSINKAKKMPKSQCSVVVFKPHENRLASLLTLYLNRAGTLSAKRCEKYKQSIQKRVQSKHKHHRKKKKSPKDNVVKATKVQKGNNEVVKWTDNCMKQFLSPKMSKDVMLWRPRSPDRNHVQVHMPPGKPSSSSTSVSRKKKKIPRATSMPCFAHPTWTTSTMSMTSTRSAPPSRRKTNRNQWHKQLARHSLTSFKSHIGRTPSNASQKRVPRKKKSNVSQIKITDQLKKKARDFLCKFVDQYINSKAEEESQEDPKYSGEVVDPSAWYNRAQKLCERIGVMEPVLEVEEELTIEGRDSAKSVQTERQGSSRSPSRKTPQTPNKPNWPEVDLGSIKIEDDGKNIKAVPSKDENEATTSEKHLEELTIEGLAITPKTEILATQSEDILKTKKSDSSKKIIPTEELSADKHKEKSGAKVRKGNVQKEEIRAEPNLKITTPSEPIIMSSETKVAVEATKMMPMSKSDISRPPGAEPGKKHDPGKKHGTTVKTRKTSPDAKKKSSSHPNKTVAELLQTRKNPSLGGKFKTLHNRPAGDTASNVTSVSTELCSVELENESSNMHSLSVDGVSYNIPISTEEYDRCPKIYYTGGSEKKIETLKKQLTEFWNSHTSKTELKADLKSELRAEECNEKSAKKSDVPRRKQKRKNSVSRG